MNPFSWDFSRSQSRYTLEHIKALMEIGAYVAALVFFIYKVLTGYLITGLSLKVECVRVHSDDPACDQLSITATAKKGKTGTLRLHDAQARVTVVGHAPQILDLAGIERLTFKPDITKWPGKTRRKISWKRAKHPFLNLAPGDEGQFSTACEVPRNLPATVEVVILCRRLLGLRRSQWRSSTVSLRVPS